MIEKRLFLGHSPFEKYNRWKKSKKKFEFLLVELYTINSDLIHIPFDFPEKTKKGNLRLLFKKCYQIHSIVT